MLKQGVNQDAAQGTEKEQQIAQLIHGKHRTATGWAHAAARQQRHDRQRPAAAAGRGAVGKLRGHHHAETFQRCDPIALIAQQQAQAQGVDAPAEQNHAEHDQQPLQRKVLQARTDLAAAEQHRDQYSSEQADQQHNAATHAARSIRPRCSVSQSILVMGVRPSASSRSRVRSQ